MEEWLKENWKLVAAAGGLFVSTVLSTIIIVKKSGGKLSAWEVLKTVLLEQIPSWISIVEREGSGEEKKNAVINLAVKKAGEFLGRNLSTEETELIISLASRYIELVLATPQKKEVPQVEEQQAKKSKYRI